MLAFMRFILRIRNREHILLTNYKKEHPHFFAYLTFDALLSIGLVFGAVQIGSSLQGATPTQILLEDVGGHTFSATELIAHVPTPSQHGKRYWLGAFNGFTYKTNYMTPGALKVSYVSPGGDMKNGGHPFLTITAYESDTQVKNGMSGRVHQETSTTNVRGDSIIYDGSLMNKIEISRSHSTEIIVIDYSVGQNLASMIYDSENLQEIN